jgi:DNA-binding response OmpR family regulator
VFYGVKEKNMADKVLVVDDDISVSTMLKKIVKSNGIDADSVSSGEDALLWLSNQSCDLILLDINMHGMDGFEVIQKVREQGIQTPIIIVSARTEDFDTLYGLDIGADDYVTKPFNPITLGAKIKALIRRSRSHIPESNTMITAGPFRYDTASLRFYKNDVEILLSSKENTLMKLFMDNVNRVFSKDMIYDMVWGNAIIDENAVMVYINRLRQKIEDDPSNPQYIKTIRGLGYRFIVS